jgi:YYY domain-containing protein
VAGLVTTATFRLAMPYAFLPPATDLPIDAEKLGPVMTLASRVGDPVGFRPNPAWLDQMRSVRVQVTGNSDIPPNHQWGHRVPLLFPWVNMVRIGLGWPLGVLAWLAVAWSVWEIARRHPGAHRLVLPTLWTLIVFVWQGSGWVTTMRYFLPIYGTLALLAAWALITIWDRVQALLRLRRTHRWRWPAVVSAALAGAVVIATFAWGFAVSRIYTRPVTRVAASQWMLERIPSDVTLLFDTPQGPRQHQVGLRNDWPPADQLSQDQTRPDARHTYLAPGASTVALFELPFEGILTGIRLNHVVDPLARNSPHILDVRLSLATGEAPDLVDTSIAGVFMPGDAATGGDVRGDSYEIATQPAQMSARTLYALDLRPDSAGPLVLAGSSIATEGVWDDPVPFNTAPYAFSIWEAQYSGYELNMVWEDLPEKRALLQHILDHTDYITISSNRFYATLNRNPQRWPMTVDYYEALFGGELGFELIGDFASRPALGPIEFFDDTAEEAWTVYDHPRVFIFRKTSDYSPERTASILGQANLDGVVRVTARHAEGKPVSIPLPPPRAYGDAVSGVIDLGSASDWTQYDAARRDLYSQAQAIGVIVWWLAVTAFGWIAFPILWVGLPGLPDRAFPLARLFGLLIVAWLSWLLASLKAVPWTSWGLALSLGLIAALSAALAVPRRAALLHWLRSSRRYIIIVEALTALLFVAFVLVRLGNPDLWHPIFGGEKPMDLAYFNAVLRSEVFPPYNPWFAGETINYYYFGFVIVGWPTKLLSVPPTLAYNLILPTLFALTGIGAFSAAYNLVAPLREGHDPASSAGMDEQAVRRLYPGFWATLRRWPDVTPGELFDALTLGPSADRAAAAWQPYAAGVAALLLAVVLGNLDQIRTLMWGLAELGHGAPEWVLTYFPNFSDVSRGLGIVLRDNQPLYSVGLGEWYWNATRVIPVPISPEGIPIEMGPITEFPFFTFLYGDLHAHMIAFPLTLFAITWCIAQVRAASLDPGTPLHQAARLPVGMALGWFSGMLVIGALRPTNTWDWPTYLALGMGASVLAHFYLRRSERAVPALGAAGLASLALGALFFYFGMTSVDVYATDDPALPLAGLGALAGLVTGYALAVTLLRARRSPDDPHDGLHYWITLLGGGLKAAALAGGSLVLFLPYVASYEAGYERVIPWLGSRTPLWAYLDILGLFLFVTISWLAVDLWKLARQASRRHAVPLAVALIALTGLTILAARLVSPIAAVCLPLMSGALVLFFAPGQPVAKRLALIMLLGALALTLLVEVVVLWGDLSRMNTVFKFYLQVWLLLAVVSGSAIGWLWPALRTARDLPRLAWGTALTLLILLAAMYTVTAARAKIADRWNPNAPHTLDGMASYMPYWVYGENGATFNLLPDYEAIRWLQDNVDGTPVVLEALSVREYLWGNRVSIYTGLPAVIGWSWHQRQQQPPLAGEVLIRHVDVPELYNTTNMITTLQLLDRYNIELVIVGDLERAYYDPMGLAKFERMAERGYLNLIYARNNTMIYQVVRE